MQSIEDLLNMSNVANNTRSSTSEFLVKPSKYNDSVSIETFIAEFERVAVANNWNDEKMARVFPALLPTDCVWLETIEDLATESRNSFIAIKAEIDSGNRGKKLKNWQELANIKRKTNESLPKLAHRVHVLVDRSFGKFAASNKTTLELFFFLNCLPLDIQVLLCNPDMPTSVKNAVNAAEGLETAKHITNLRFDRFKTQAGNSSNSKASADKKTKKFCNFCKLSGHTKESCFKAKASEKKKKDSSSSSGSEVKSIHEPTLKKCQVIPISFKEVVTQALCDTGADVSVIPAHLVEKSRIKKFSATTMPAGVGGRPLKVMGETTIDFAINNHVFRHKFIVLDEKNVILGIDFFSKNNLRVSFDFDNFIEIISKTTNETIIKYCNCDKMSSYIYSICAIDDEDYSDTCDVLHEEASSLTETLFNRFSKVVNGLGKCDLINHKIVLKENAQPCQSYNYKIPLAFENEIDDVIKSLVEYDVIEESFSEWRSPIVPIRKPDGTIRLAIDYRNVNDRTKNDAFPVPQIDRIIKDIRDAKIFSKIDLAKGYYQIVMNPEDKPITAFEWHNKLWQFKRMPFGLSTAPKTFLRVMDQIFHQFPFVKVYFDDILVFSTNVKQHMNNLMSVFQTLEKYGFTINRDKSKFFCKEVSYLGYRLSADSIQPANNKIEKLKNFPIPTNRKEVASFLGLAGYYRKFVPDFGNIAIPLENLKRKYVRFNWSEECNIAFEKLRSIISSDNLLKPPLPGLTFLVRCDASEVGMGAVLLQKDDNNDERIIEYASKAFSDTQKRYSTIEKEATAIMWSIQNWHYYLIGKKFILETDHKPLIWLQSKRNLTNKLGRMALKLQEYDFTIDHIDGSNNVIADALSRICLIETFDWKLEQDKDGILRDCMASNPDQFIKKGGILYKMNDGFAALCVPSKILNVVICNVHNELLHVGQRKTMEVIRRRYYHPFMRDRVKSLINACDACQRCKDYDNRPKTNHPRQDYSSFNVGEHWSIDIADIGSTSKGNKFLVGMIDLYSKFVIATPAKTVSSQKIIQFLKTTWKKVGCPKSLLCDRGSVFESQEFKNFCDENNVEIKYAVAYLHQTNGSIERFFRTFRNMIRTADFLNDWDVKLQSILNAYHSVRHESTGIPPSILFNGEYISLPSDQLAPLDSNIYALSDQSKHQALSTARQKLREIAAGPAFEVRTFAVGDLVLIRRRNKKNQPFIGPFQVKEKTGRTTYVLRGATQGPTLKCHINQMKEFVGTAELEDIPRRGRPGSNSRAACNVHFVAQAATSSSSAT